MVLRGEAQKHIFQQKKLKIVTKSKKEYKKKLKKSASFPKVPGPLWNPVGVTLVPTTVQMFLIRNNSWEKLRPGTLHVMVRNAWPIR